MIQTITATGVATTTLVTSATTALASNPARVAWSIQNLGTNALYVYLGQGCTTSTFSYILPGGTAQDDGKGITLAMEAGAVYTGAISVAGTSPRCSVVEIAP